MELVIDFESRSPIDIKKCGMYIYWQNPYTEVMMLSVKKDLEPTRVWIPPAFRHLCPTEIEDDELEQLLTALRDREDMRLLFKLAKDAPPDDVRQAVKIIDALRASE